MNLLPTETVFKILSFVGISDINNMKNTCKFINMVCEDPMLWYCKIRVEFPDQINTKSNDLSWKQLYINIYSDSYSIVPIYQHNTCLGHIELQYSDCQNSLTHIEKYLITPSSITFKDKYDNMIHRYQYIQPQMYVHTFTSDRINTIQSIEISENYNIGLLEFLIRQQDLVRIYGYHMYNMSTQCYQYRIFDLTDNILDDTLVKYKGMPLCVDLHELSREDIIKYICILTKKQSSYNEVSIDELRIYLITELKIQKRIYKIHT